MALKLRSPFEIVRIPQVVTEPLQEEQKAREIDGNKEPVGVAFTSVMQEFLKHGQKGIIKPSLISFTTLRRMARTLPLAAICKNTLKHQISKVKWDLVPLDKNKASDAHYNEISKLLQFPNRNMESFRTLINKLVDDILDLDAGVIEKVRSRDGKIVELYNRDGATILPVYDKYGIAGDPAYIQVLPDKAEPVAAWSNLDMIYMMQNPQLDVAFFGYGMSPIEMVILSATALLMADEYNQTWFNKNTLPPAIINLGEGVPPARIKEFMANFIGKTMGLANAWNSLVVSSKDLKMEKIRPDNTDMQFMEYELWLSKIVIAAYEMSPQDVGLTMDINRATAEVQQDISKNKGLRSLLQIIREYINNEIIADFGYDDEFTFEWLDLDLNDASDQANIDKIYLQTGVTSINEVRQRQGFEPIKGGEKPFIIAGNAINYLDATPLGDLSDTEIDELRVAQEPEVTDRILNQVQDPEDEQQDQNQQTSDTSSTGVSAGKRNGSKNTKEA